MGISFSEYIEFVNSRVPAHLPKEQAAMKAVLDLFYYAGRISGIYSGAVFDDIVLHRDTLEDAICDNLRAITMLWLIAFDSLQIDMAELEAKLVWKDCAASAHRFDYVGVSEYVKEAGNVLGLVTTGILPRTALMPLFHRLGDMAWFVPKSLSEIAERDVLRGNQVH